MQLLIPPKATHGLRAKIDLSAVWGADLTRITMLQRVRHLDHRGYEVTGAFCPAVHEENTK